MKSSERKHSLPFFLGEDLLEGKQAVQLLRFSHGTQGLVTVFFKWHKPRDERHYRHSALPHFSLNLLFSGRANLKLKNGNLAQCEAGKLWQILPNQSVEVDFEENSIEIGMTIDAETSRHLQALDHIRSEFSTALLKRVHPAVRLLHKLHRDIRLGLLYNSSIQMQRLEDTLRFLYQASSSAKSSTNWLEEAKTLLESNLELPVYMEDIADQLGLPYHQLRRDFRRATGQSPADYRIHKKIGRACLLLLNLSVKETASTLGYPTPFSLSRQFSQIMGESPTAFKSRILDSTT